MWKRDEAVRVVGGARETDGKEQEGGADGRETQTGSDSGRSGSRDMAIIGKSVVIKGDLGGSENLTIEGKVEGKIEVRQHELTIGPNGKIKAQVFAKAVVVLGEVTGNITATEKVHIRGNGSVDGDLSSPRVAIAEGAHFRGNIDMQRTAVDSPRAVEAKAENRPAQPPSVRLGGASH